MTKRMLIDATHAEETRVVVLDGTRLEDFDVETSAKRHLKGNIYLAKVVRVEPSLQAAFVEYGGNRHGFLAFSEIHPDYYQIPIADRQRLLELEAEEARLEEEEDELEMALSESAPPPPRVVEPARQSPGRRDRRHGRNRLADADTAIASTVAPEAWARADTPSPFAPARPVEVATPEPEAWARAGTPALTVAKPPTNAAFDQTGWARPDTPPLTAIADDAADIGSETEIQPAIEQPPEAWALPAMPALLAVTPDGAWPDEFAALEPSVETQDLDDRDSDPDDDGSDVPDMDDDEGPPPETMGGDPDSVDEREERRLPPRFMRNYKIQEVIHRRQILLVQVVKEERGTKGAALTTYLSLAGRFSVLMPNSPRGGGISRKITSVADRRRLKEVMVELDIPRGMGLIIRTAGAARPKPEIKRDCEYLLRLWDDIREHTMKSIAPALIYEEASLIKRAIRDVYSRDIDEIQVDGTEGWRAAHEFMRMLMPSHARKVQLWNEHGQPLFARYQVESQLDAMLNPIVQLRSGGYLVINQAEALVAIDVNSGRSTRERNVEETALRTNLEAADEVARQLRLRDLAGLIVIDFIDMESRRHDAMVERRLKDALRNDRARIQVGHISHFGLLEMSRQRLRPSLTETSFITCPHCAGMGHVRSTESAAIHVLRGVEDEASKRRAAEAVVHVATPIALYLLNHKRERLQEIELRYGMRVIIAADDTQLSPRYQIDRVRAHIAGEAPQFITPDSPPPSMAIPYDDAPEDEEQAEPVARIEDAEPVIEEATEAKPASDDAEEQERRRRRRRRRRGRREDGSDADPSDRDDTTEEAAREPVAEMAAAEAAETTTAEGASEEPDSADADAGEDGRGRRRGRRGGRRRRREGGEDIPTLIEPGMDQPDLPPVYSGPTPANPFGSQAFDIFDVMEQVETAAAERMAAAPIVAPPPPLVEAWARADQPALFGAEPRSAPVAAAPVAEAPVIEAPVVEAPVVEVPVVEVPVIRAPAPVPTHAMATVEVASQPVPATDVVAAGATWGAEAPEPWASAGTPALTGIAVTPEVKPVVELAPEARPVVEQARAPKPMAPEAPVFATLQPEPSPASPPLAANDAEPVAGPAIKPIVIGEDAAAPVERKRGWWRRGG